MINISFGEYGMIFKINKINHTNDQYENVNEVIIIYNFKKNVLVPAPLFVYMAYLDNQAAY